MGSTREPPSCEAPRQPTIYEYLITIFRKTTFNKLWLLLILRAKLDLTKLFFVGGVSSPGILTFISEGMSIGFGVVSSFSVGSCYL